HDTAIDRRRIRADRSRKSRRRLGAQDDVHGGVGAHVGHPRFTVLVTSNGEEEQGGAKPAPPAPHPPSSRFPLPPPLSHCARHGAPVASDVAFAGSFALRAGCELSGGMFVFVLRSEMSYGNRAGIFTPVTTGVRFGVHVRL